MRTDPWEQFNFQESPKKRVAEINVQAIGWPDPFTSIAIRILTRNHMWTKNDEEDI
jgi:hypothetical protein